MKAHPEWDAVIQEAWRKCETEWAEYLKQLELSAKADELMILHGKCEIIMDGDKILEVNP